MKEPGVSSSLICTTVKDGFGGATISVRPRCWLSARNAKENIAQSPCCITVRPYFATLYMTRITFFAAYYFANKYFSRLKE